MSLAINSSCILNVTFISKSVGSATGSIQLTDNANSSPQTISLSAAAGDFSIAAANGNSTSLTINAGQTATFNLQIQPNQFQGTIQLSCSGAPSAAICSAIPSQLSVNGSGPTGFQVQVATSPRNSSVLPAWHFRFDGRPVGLLRNVAAFLLLLLAYVFSRTRRAWRVIPTASIIALAIILLGCGGTGGGNGSGGVGLGGTPAGTYTLVVSAQAVGGSRAVNLQLTVN